MASREPEPKAKYTDDEIKILQTMQSELARAFDHAAKHHNREGLRTAFENWAIMRSSMADTAMAWMEVTDRLKSIREPK